MIKSARNQRFQTSRPVNHLLISCRNSAKARKRHIPFDLTLEHLTDLCRPMRCAVTGHRLSWEWPPTRRGQCNPWKPSVDRIDPSKGYVVGNVRIVSWIYNLAKSTWTDEVVSQFRGDGPHA